MKEFGKFIQSLRKRKRLDVLKLSEKTGIPVHTLQKYEAGRPIPPEKVQLFRKLLCSSADEEEFDRLAQLPTNPKERSPLDMVIDSPDARLRICPLAWEPFSGKPKPDEPARFLDSLLKSMLELGGITFVEPLIAQSRSAAENFDVKERIRWLEYDQADVLLNLVSLQRMKKVAFLLTPIRVSLNGVILLSDRAKLKSARILLANGGDPVKHGFRFLAIENEVGHVYLQKTRHIDDNDITTYKSLDANFLATRLERLQSNSPMLVSDEITALNVVRAMGGRAMLVFQPSSDQAIAEYDKRRVLPAHYLGIGLRRDNNGRLIGYLTEALSMFLASETEMISALYEQQYLAVVKYVRSCLNMEDNVYLSGLRQVSKTEILSQVDPVSKLIRQRAIGHLVGQQARSSARRYLHLTRKSLQNLPSELQPWVRVLVRARERILIADARDRSRIKYVIVTALKRVLGIDPIENFDPLTHDQFLQAVGAEHWQELKYALEQELDLDFPAQMSSRPAQMNSQESQSDLSLEKFVSLTQQLLDSSAQSAGMLVINPVDDKNRSAYEKLLQEYAKDPGKPEELPQDLLRAGPRTEFLAVNLGAPFGLIKTIVDALPPDIAPDGCQSLEITDMFVTDSIRLTGVNRRLIRKAIDHAQLNGFPYVWIDPHRYEREIRQKFIRCGFVYGDNESHLFYRLDGIGHKPDISNSET